MASRSILALAPLLLVWTSAAYADLPTLRFLELRPAGANAGTTAEVRADGAEFDTVDRLVFAHSGLSATLVQPRVFKIQVAADAPEGTYDVWAVGKYGISNPRLFAVSHGLKDVTDREPNNSPQQAQEVVVNTAINGLTDANGSFYRFHARQGQRLTFDCLAQRLLALDRRGISAEIVLTLWTSDGRMLARSDHYYGNDPFIDHQFSDEGWYVLQAEEMNYAAGKTFRLVISDRPHVENVFPRALEPGKPTELTVYGQNLGPGSQPSRWTIDGLPLEEKRLTFTLPPDSGTRPFQFTEHPTGLAFPVTCSTVCLAGGQLRPPWEGGALNAVNLLSAWTSPTLEAEPNDTRGQAQKVRPEMLASGRFDHPGDVDWYEFQTSPGEAGKYTLEVYCERLGGRADPLCKVEDERGNQVVELDDQSFGGSFASGTNRDPRGQVDLPAGRLYRVMVKDLHGRGNARCQYVLSLRKTQTDFAAMAWLPHITLGGVGNCRGATIRRGGGDFILVAAVHAGVPCPVTITADDLPPGLHASSCSLRPISNATGAIVLRSDPDAPEWVGPIRLTATAQVDGQTIRRSVVPCTASDPYGGGRPTQAFMAAVRSSAPFTFRVVPDTLTISAGSRAELKFVAVRYGTQCQGKIEIQNTTYSTLPMVIPNQMMPPGATETSFVFEVPKQAAPGNYTLCFQGITTVPVARDSKSKPEDVTAYEPSVPLSLTVTSAK